MAYTIQVKSWVTGAAGLARRVIRLMLSPAKEFVRLAEEPETVRDVFLGWILPLVSIMVVANFISAMVFGIDAFKDSPLIIHLPLSDAPAYALPVLVQSLVMPLVMAVVITILAGFFGGQRDHVQAVRTAAYVGTPAWLLGIFEPVWKQASLFRVTPVLSIGLIAGALWSIYFLFRALSPMMKSPPGKMTLLYALATVVIMFVLWRSALHLTFDTISYLNGERSWHTAG